MTTKLLQDMGMENVSHIDTGFGGWKEDGLDIEDYDTWKATNP
ncbi:MAG: 3-mercaptopyruvate sulfurtransferase SseA [Verrucomicrobiales bacterium]